MTRVEQRLDVDEDRLLADGDQVLVVHVRAVQHVQQGQQSALPVVEATHLGQVVARLMYDVLRPAVPIAGRRPTVRMSSPVLSFSQPTNSLKWLCRSSDRGL